MKTKNIKEIIVNNPIEVKPNENIEIYANRFDCFIEKTNAPDPEVKSKAIKKLLKLIPFVRD